MNIPDPITVNTGDQIEVYQKIEKFFDEIQEQIEKVTEKGPYFERRVCGLFRHSWDTTTKVETDANTHLLLYKQRVVATVIETRTDYNYVHFDFFIANLENLVNDERNP